MEIQSISDVVTTPSAQKVTSVTNRVEGDNPKISSELPKVAETAPASKEEIAAQVEQLNRQLELLGQSITFGVDDSTNATVVKVVDKSTDELIRQLPSEGSLKVMQNIQEFLTRMQQNGSITQESLTGSLINEII
ncbi:hypothetical protein THMIRHAS_09020 [Thiosulfatimonas sediminis]|uniref:Flagellar protein FlaG n=1 Tax=Thiosulfatimonas sediminis TaxID=2675054 RepID=A0A6F8PTU2_9GAMM|nr:flagellar protein FlaG [Thiosulfatimonas sediminis]BBP45529.1 hypothetical protein THMIRHAS_09020 [Thiosulfatimonas sediminis]